MKTDQLTRKIDALSTQIQSPAQVDKQTLPFDMDLFTPEERTQVQALLAVVEPKYHWIEEGEYAGRLLLDKLSVEDLDELSRWDDLQTARRGQQ
jgi:hypothetical protein